MLLQNGISIVPCLGRNGQIIAWNSGSAEIPLMTEQSAVVENGGAEEEDDQKTATRGEINNCQRCSGGVWSKTMGG